MTEAKWTEFLHQFWTILSYWEMIQCFRAKELNGSFFALSAFACRNMFLLSIAKFVELCMQTEQEVEFGPDAVKTFSAIRALYRKGDTKDRSHLDFDNCGIGPFRDRVLGHPLNSVKVVLEKEPYKISLEWATVEETLRLIKLFVDEVERHHAEKDPNRWSLNTYKEGMFDVNHDFADLQMSLEHGAQYEGLLREVLLAMGNVTIRMNYQTHDLEVVN